MIGDHKEILKLNEAKLLAILCRFINENVSSVDLCEGVWGKGMANEGKRCALKNLVTNLRKVCKSHFFAVVSMPVYKVLSID